LVCQPVKSIAPPLFVIFITVILEASGK